MRPIPTVATLALAATLLFAPSLCAEEAQAQREAASERDGDITEWVRDIERIKQENRELRGEIETLNHQLRRLEDRQRDHYTDLDERIRELQQRSPPSLPTPERSADSRNDEANGDATSPDDEAEAYQSAFDKLGDGLYAEAREGFSTVLAHHPEGRYAANAAYWIGETFYAERNFERAEVFFQRLIEDYPQSNKLADARLKLGYTAFEQGDIDLALERLEALRSAHPETAAAELAQQRISQIRRLRSAE